MSIDVSTLVNVVSALAVVAGIAFGIIQLRQSVRDRKNAAAVAIVGTVQTQEVRQAVRTILALPHDADPEVIRSDPELLDAALAVDSACEMWGSMVYEDVVDHHMLDRMVGGWIRGTWSRLGTWVAAERRDLGNPNIAEWWQWLVEMLEDDPDPGKQSGAHIAYRLRTRRG